MLLQAKQLVPTASCPSTLSDQTTTIVLLGLSFYRPFAFGITIRPLLVPVLTPPSRGGGGHQNGESLAALKMPRFFFAYIFGAKGTEDKN